LHRNVYFGCDEYDDDESEASGTHSTDGEAFLGQIDMDVDESTYSPFDHIVGQVPGKYFGHNLVQSLEWVETIKSKGKWFVITTKENYRDTIKFLEEAVIPACKKSPFYERYRTTTDEYKAGVALKFKMTADSYKKYNESRSRSYFLDENNIVMNPAKKKRTELEQKEPKQATTTAWGQQVVCDSDLKFTCTSSIPITQSKERPKSTGSDLNCPASSLTETLLKKVEFFEQYMKEETKRKEEELAYFRYLMKEEMKEIMNNQMTQMMIFFTTAMAHQEQNLSSNEAQSETPLTSLMRTAQQQHGENICNTNKPATENMTTNSRNDTDSMNERDDQKESPNTDIETPFKADTYQYHDFDIGMTTPNVMEELYTEASLSPLKGLMETYQNLKRKLTPSAISTNAPATKLMKWNF
jgi:hypothetical protein